MGFCAMQLCRELDSMIGELDARRRFDRDVGEYLKEKGSEDEFNAWRTARHAPPATSAPAPEPKA